MHKPQGRYNETSGYQKTSRYQKQGWVQIIAFMAILWSVKNMVVNSQLTSQALSSK